MRAGLSGPVPDQYHNSEDVLQALLSLQASGEPCALAVVTHVAGGSMRGPGALMAISGAGERFGYISNGCVDGDITARAVSCIETGAHAELRYGEGSSFKDIVLPCGGSIDVLVIAKPDAEGIKALSDSLMQRKSLTIYCDVTHGLSLSETGGTALILKPKLRLQVAGRGAAMIALADQAAAAGLDVYAASPDPQDLAALPGAQTRLLSPGQQAFERADAFTAVTIMFHDHDREPPLLLAALESDAFFIGAMGSRKTHAARLDTLRAMGVNEEELARIQGPIGLVPSLRDANLVAISALAHVIAAAQKTCRL